MSFWRSFNLNYGLKVFPWTADDLLLFQHLRKSCSACPDGCWWRVRDDQRCCVSGSLVQWVVLAGTRGSFTRQIFSQYVRCGPRNLLLYNCLLPICLGLFPCARVKTHCRQHVTQISVNLVIAPNQLAIDKNRLLCVWFDWLFGWLAICITVFLKQ